MDNNFLITRKEIKSNELVNDTMKTLLWMFLIYFAASVAFSGILVGSGYVNIFFTALVFYPVFTLLPIFGYAKIKPLEKPKTFIRIDKKMDGKLMRLVIILGVLIALAYISIILILVYFVDPSILQNANPLGSAVSTSYSTSEIINIIAQLVVVFVISAGVFEELFFRGFMLNGLRALGQKKAIIITSVAFGLMHLNLFQGTIAFLISLFIGYIAYTLKNTRYAIALHIAYNSIIVVFALLVLFIQYGIITTDSMLYYAMGFGVAGIIAFPITIKLVISRIKGRANDIEMQANSIEKDTNEQSDLKEEPANEPFLFEVYAPVNSAGKAFADGMTVEDYQNPVNVTLSKSAKISFGVYILVTASFTILGAMIIQ